LILIVDILLTGSISKWKQTHTKSDAATLKDINFAQY